MEVNRYQTPIDDLLLKDLDSSSQSEFWDSISKIKLLQVLTSTERKYSKDLERWDNPNLPLKDEVEEGLPYRALDSKGRIRVDLENPHILTDMEYFRPTAKHFEEFGVYTKFFENPDPDSDYMKFWTEERRRCIEGYMRESDGEWIPGYLYHYWNYGRVMRKLKTGSRTAKEIEGFPRLYDSHYWWFHYIERAETLGLFGLALKKRRWGYSYMLATMMSRNYTHIKQSKSYIMASQKEYLYRDGPMPKFKMIQAFNEAKTPFGSPRLVDTIEHTKSGYKDKKHAVEMGRFSEVMGVTCKDDPDKGRGKAGKLVAFEEIGVFPQLEKTWTVAEESVKQGDLTYGFLLGNGTGGTEGADFTSAEKMFYHPKAYNVLHMSNIYSKTNGSGECSFFVPSYLSYEECFDENGNSDVIKALIKILKERQKIRTTTHDSNRLLQKKAEIPITPEEAVLRKEGSIFPVLDIKEYLSSIYPLEEKFTAPHYVGNLTINGSGEVEFLMDKYATPVRHYPTKPDIDRTGCVEIFELPQKTKDRQRYILGCLPANEKVLTDKGLKNIQEITLENKLVNEEGNYVDIHNLQEYNVVDEDIYKFKISNTFRTTTFTGEHPILVSKPLKGYWGTKKCKNEGVRYTYHRFNFNYLEVKNISKGDWLKVPNIYRSKNNFDINPLWQNKEYRVDRFIKCPFDKEDFWWFVGLWLGDGWCESNGYSICIAFNKNEEFYIKKYENVVQRLFNRKVSKRIRGNGVECKFSLQQLNYFLTETFGKYARGKFLPEWVKRIDENLKQSLILGYLDSDGSIIKNKYKQYNTEYVSINLELLEGIQDILFSIGIISSLNRLRKQNIHTINGKISKTRETYHLRLGHHETLKLVKLIDCYEDIKISRIDFNNLPTTRRNPQYKCFLDDSLEYIYFQITDIIKDKYTGKVYNFACDTHTFMSHHITTHNCDPIDSDEVVYSVSLASVFVFDRYTRRIVAEYTGRPKTVNEFFEICYRLAIYYNGTIMYENNKKGMYGYFQLGKNALHLLADFPDHLRDKQTLKPTAFTGNTSKGYTSNPEIKKMGRTLQSDWLVSQAYASGMEEPEYDENGDPIEKIQFNLHKVRSIGYLEEASQWNQDGNFDRVDAMTAVMIYDVELGQYQEQRAKEKVKTLAQDPFFNRYNKSLKSVDEKVMMKGWNV